MSRLYSRPFLLCAGILLVPQVASAVGINTVYVGNVGNASDPTTGDVYGSYRSAIS